MLLQEQRELVVEYGRRLVSSGLTEGTFGNLSVFDRTQNLMAISPSGMDYFRTNPEDVVVLTPEGTLVDGCRKPSSEYDLHRLFYLGRPDVDAVVHTHSTFATVLSCLRWSIEPIHYLVAYSGRDVPASLITPSAPWNWRRPLTPPWGRSITPVCWAATGCLPWGAVSPSRSTRPNRSNFWPRSTTMPAWRAEA